MRHRTWRQWAVAALALLGVGAAVAGPAPGSAASTLVLEHPDGPPPAWLDALATHYRQRSGRDITLRPAGAEAAGQPAPVLRLLSTAARHDQADAEFRPLHQLIGRRARGAWRVDAVLAATVNDRQQRLQALPLALAAPVLFVNRTLLADAGLDPDASLATWPAVQQAADRLVDHGLACPLTAASPAVTLFEQVGALQGAPIVGATQQAAFNGLLHVKHLALLTSWVKSRFLIPYGRHDEAVAWFARGDCALLVADSGHLSALAGIDLGVRPLPRHDDHRGGPGAVQADGASLWISATAPGAALSAAAAFIDFVFSAEAQQILVDAGFLPLQPDRLSLVTPATVCVALAASRQARGLAHLSRHPRWRQALDEALAEAWSGRKAVKEALDDAVSALSLASPRLAAVRGGTS